jgi:glutathione S-transferase
VASYRWVSGLVSFVHFDSNNSSLKFAFPKELEARSKDFPLIFETFYPNFKEEPGIKDYLSSDRRLKYSQGIFRYYPELDRQ